MRASVIILAALAATALMRRRSAAVRHWILSAAILCAAATPLLERVVPAWQIGLGGSVGLAWADLPLAGLETRPSPAAPRVAPPAGGSARPTGPGPAGRPGRV